MSDMDNRPEGSETVLKLEIVRYPCDDAPYAYMVIFDGDPGQVAYDHYWEAERVAARLVLTGKRF